MVQIFFILAFWHLISAKVYHSDAVIDKKLHDMLGDNCPLVYLHRFSCRKDCHACGCGPGLVCFAQPKFSIRNRSTAPSRTSTCDLLTRRCCALPSNSTGIPRTVRTLHFVPQYSEQASKMASSARVCTACNAAITVSCRNSAHTRSTIAVVTLNVEFTNQCKKADYMFDDDCKERKVSVADAMSECEKMAYNDLIFVDVPSGGR